MNNYLAFHNDDKLQTKMIAEIEKCVKNGQLDHLHLNKGIGDNFRGDFIGCIVHAFLGNCEMTESYDNVHTVFDAYGFTNALTRLCEQIFYNLPTRQSLDFFQAIPNALNLGSDLSLVSWKFLDWLVLDVVSKCKGKKLEIYQGNCLIRLIDMTQDIELELACAIRADAIITVYATRAAGAALGAGPGPRYGLGSRIRDNNIRNDTVYKLFAHKLIEIIKDS